MEQEFAMVSARWRRGRTKQARGWVEAIMATGDGFTRTHGGADIRETRI
jgi:hypothetical protein